VSCGVPVLITSFGDGRFEINSRKPSTFEVAVNRVVSQTLALKFSSGASFDEVFDIMCGGEKPLSLPEARSVLKELRLKLNPLKPKIRKAAMLPATT
jgi:hypothetical protein